MKKFALIILASLSAAPALFAEMPKADDIIVKDLKVARDGSRLNLSCIYDLSQMPTGQNQETRISPIIYSDADTLHLESVTVAGRNRYIMAERNNLLTNSYYRAGKVKNIDYSTSTAWQQWMENAKVDLLLENIGCCESRKTLADRQLAALNMGERSFSAPLYYETPVEERVKTRNAKGEAYIDFKVGKTDILPDYRNNPAELAKIRATIDSVKNDTDTRITRLDICGYASPEGSYAGNERLAKGRTDALADYVRSLYSFPRNLMQTSWVAEDWAGLRKFVAGSEMAAKQQMLAIIDGNLSPDEKDRKLKVDFPTDYAYMLENWYPALRHSDYEVEYVVRSYTDPKEIAKVMKTQPGKLSLRELFILGETLDPASQEYADVFETAVRLYPDDKVANLNAANVALQRGDLQSASARLAKAGDSAKVEYARGVLAARQGDYEKAEEQFRAAARGGLDVSAALRSLDTLTAPEVVKL